jgi:GTP cyclohydrolase IB
MIDVQASADDRGIPIDRVGIEGLRYPITVLDKAAGFRHTVGTVSLAVSLSADARGTHMSRFVELLSEHHGELTARTIPGLLARIRERLLSHAAYCDIAFPFFLERAAPITGATALLDYQCRFTASDVGGSSDFVLTVEVPVTTLCPCSKAISDYGAHNQRGYVTVAVRAESNTTIIWIEDIIEAVERCASSPVYPLLKRADERHVTMQAFEKPAFVEDVVREVSSVLKQRSDIAWYRVEARNHESIHNHAALAVIEEIVNPMAQQHLVSEYAGAAS